MESFETYQYKKLLVACILQCIITTWMISVAMSGYFPYRTHPRSIVVQTNGKFSYYFYELGIVNKLATLSKNISKQLSYTLSTKVNILVQKRFHH